jgi:hypothetical protein
MKRLLISLIALFSAPLAFGQGALYQTCHLQNAQGQAINNAQVWFLTQPANPSALTPLANVYTSSALTTPITQPVLTNGFGDCTAYLSPGLYTVVFISPFTGTLIYPDQSLSIGGGVTQLIAGTGISLSPSGGTGAVTINSTTGAAIVPNPSGAQTITQPINTNFNVITSGTGLFTNNGSAMPVLTPSASQTVVQPSATSLYVNSLNNILYTNPAISMVAACTALSGANGKVIVTLPQTISSATVIPANCSLEVTSTGLITVNSGQSLQIQGGFSAGLYQVFAGTGAVYFHNSAYGVTQTVSTSGPEKIYPQWFGAFGNNKAAGFTATATNPVITINGRQVFSVGDTVIMPGAGVSGATLTTTVTALGTGTITVNTAPSTTVSTNSAIYTGDDTVAMQAWANSVRANATNSPTYGYAMQSSLGPSKLYVPKGQYVVGCTNSLRIYSGVIVEFEAANTTHSARLLGCSELLPAVRLEPYNLDMSGNTINTSGNLILKYFALVQNFGGTNASAASALSFDPSPVNWSDAEIDHAYFGGIVGSAIGGGFNTIVTATSGASTITVGDGSPFITGEQIVIAGAGTAGAALTTTIGGCSTTLCGNTFTISPSIITSVTNAVVTPISDIFGLKINDTELDVGFRFLQFLNSASGTIWVDNGEIFQPVGGAAFSSAKALSLSFTNNKCYGCGTPNAGTADTYGINWTDASASKTADLFVSHSQFYGITGQSNAESSPVLGQGLRSIVVKNSQFWNVDSFSAYTGVLSIANGTVDVEGNLFQANTLTTSAPTVFVELCCSSPDASRSAIVEDNTFQNLNGTTAIAKAVNFDAVPTNFSSIGNVINGNITSIGNAQSVPIVATPTAGQAACIKAAGPPVVIGYCGAITAGTGVCVCN